MSIEVFNESGHAGVNEEMLIDVASFSLGEMDIHPDAEASIHIVDLKTITELHVRWLDLDGPTDVMTFPMDELTPGSGTALGARPDSKGPGPALLGDIVLCPEFAAKQAAAAGHGLDLELALRTVHGCLHLLGYAHATPADERELFALQNELLADWYDDVARRGVEYQPKPTGAQAFPSAADRQALDEIVPGGGIPPIGEPAGEQ